MEEVARKRQEIEKHFKQERENLEAKEHLSEAEEEKIQFFKLCDQEKICLSEMICYTKEDLVELGLGDEGTQDRILVWIARTGILWDFWLGTNIVL